MARSHRFTFRLRILNLDGVWAETHEAERQQAQRMKK
jgi:hypothetical protein